MYDKIRVTGMVIASMNVGEVDRRVTILTKERGKLSAFAKGARRPTSPLLACSNLFAFGDFILYEGRDSYNVESADIKTYFGDLLKDMSGIYYGMYVCEFAGHLTRENINAKREINLLYVTLRALEKNEMDKRLVRRVFELRFLTENGEMPEVYECVKCRNVKLIDEENAYLDVHEGGLICGKCGAGAGKFRVSRSTVYALQFIVSAPLEKLYSFNLAPEVFNEVTEVAIRWIKEHVGFKMKTEDMLLDDF